MKTRLFVSVIAAVLFAMAGSVDGLHYASTMQPRALCYVDDYEEKLLVKVSSPPKRSNNKLTIVVSF